MFIKSKMKILLWVPEYPPHHIGWWWEVYKSLAEWYLKEWHEVVVIYGYYKAKWFEKLKRYYKNWIIFYQVPEIPYPKRFPFLKTVMPIWIINYFRLKKIIKKEKIDVAHLHWYWLFFINQIAKLLRELNKKYIFTIHWYPETQNKIWWFIKKIWGFYVKEIMNQTLTRAYSITGVSNFIVKDKRNIFKNKSIIIYNWINLLEYKNINNNLDIRKINKIWVWNKIIFSMWRLSEMKWFQNIIKKIWKYEELFKTKVYYLIAWLDDWYKKELLKIIKENNYEDRVIFVWFLDLEEKKQYLKQCDVFAIPSLWEPFGLVWLEGMIYNKVILTTNIWGLKEVLKNYENKILLNDLEWLVKSNMNDFKMNEVSMFSWNNIVKQYLQLMK
jgi:glycosyltransferase involved in cell wall biosynthesis